LNFQIDFYQNRIRNKTNDIESKSNYLTNIDLKKVICLPLNKNNSCNFKDFNSNNNDISFGVNNIMNVNIGIRENDSLSFRKENLNNNGYFRDNREIKLN